MNLENHEIFLLGIFAVYGIATGIVVGLCNRPQKNIYLWQSQVEKEHYSTVSGLIRLVISLECFIEITPDFLCLFMNY